ncbi:MAG: glycosyltransferase [Clostridia bacterium]|nr:glycosyltransferase [Clostridia bacterium]
MKISIYALHLSFGGVEKYVATLANMLCEKHDVEIVSTYKIDKEPAFPINPKVRITYLLEDLKPNKAELKNALRSKNILSVIREGFNAVRVLHARKSSNVKSLKSCKSDVIISTRVFHNRLIGKYAKDATKITGEHNHHNSNAKYINEVIESCKGFDYFIPISKELCDYYKEPLSKYGVSTEYIKFCIDKNPNPVEPEFSSSDIISVGRLSPEKGMCDLIEVFRLVSRKNPSARLHVVGDGDDREKMETMISEYGLTDKVTMHGYREKSYIYSLLPSTSLYVMTSRTESFGLVLLEAMSCGIPCLAFSSAQGAHEIIENGVNGYLIENRDNKALADKICELLYDKDRLHSMSRSSLETAEEFSYEKTKASWLSLMEKIEKNRQA